MFASTARGEATPAPLSALALLTTKLFFQSTGPPNVTPALNMALEEKAALPVSVVAPVTPKVLLSVTAPVTANVLLKVAAPVRVDVPVTANVLLRTVLPVTMRVLLNAVLPVTTRVLLSMVLPVTVSIPTIVVF